MIKLHNIMQAHHQIKPFIRRAPLVRSEALSALTGADVWLKLECRQPTGSFKIRGALNKLMSLDAAELERGVVTASAGNHALGLAYAAAALGISNVTVFVPQNAPAPKIAKLERFPIDLRLAGQTYDEAHHAAETFVTETGATYIPAYDDPIVIAGAGTCGFEIISDLPDTDAIIVPIGGGGLVSGIGVAVKRMSPGCQIIGVQPTASPAAKLSFEQNLPLETYDHEPTIADGLAGGFGAIPFYIARTLIDDILLFSEAELRRTVFTFVEQEQLIVEPSGSIALAPLLAEAHSFQGKTVVCVLTGANIDTALLADILNDVPGQ
ncbi:MAG: pyridoxal-phosphate dependent enzyme, partial [Anaerolineae bacterium]|nr:pyridoxal-phosphate dependent enzyme [Anaerolineae bacterium]